MKKEKKKKGRSLFTKALSMVLAFGLVLSCGVTNAFAADEVQAVTLSDKEEYSPDDTWAFYLYWVGSDLESGQANHMSEKVQKDLAPEVAKIEEAEVAYQQKVLGQIAQEIADKGQLLPDRIVNEETYFTDNFTTRSTVSNIRVAANTPAAGDASHDLAEYESVALPENVEFVIQTGGSPAWADEDVDADRMQRFHFDHTGLDEVYNGPLVNMADPQTLTDFLKFAMEDYPADHQVVILWNHGGGSSGFGVDHIYGDDIMSLPELKKAFADAMPVDRRNPPLEMIYFACCLMSNAEALDYMAGTAKYMVAAEEVTITAEEACSGWLEKFVQNTGISGKELGKLMVDAYMAGIDTYKKENGYLMATCMSLLDMRQAAKVYEAYEDFAKAALKAQIKDPNAIGDIADAAGAAVWMGYSHYKDTNLVDLTTFMKNVSKEFPKESKAVIDAVNSSILYTKATGHLQDTGGISVYYPMHMEDYSALYGAVKYLDQVCPDDDVKAMYYYKIAGCLNDAYQNYCTKAGYGTAKTLDYLALDRLHNVDVALDEAGDMLLTLTDTEGLLLQDASYELMMLTDEDIIYLGEDRYVDNSPERLQTHFAKEWVSIDGVPFATEVINIGEKDGQYRTLIEYRGDYVDLILNYNFATEKITVQGIRALENRGAMPNRTAEPLKIGETITPIYLTTDLLGETYDYAAGQSVVYTGDGIIADTTLADGYYLGRIKMTDLRGDVYYGCPVCLTIIDGEVVECEKETEISPLGQRGF